MKIFRKRAKGFTLVELIVVIAIIAVISMILIPSLLGYMQRSRVNVMNSNANELRKQINYFLTQAAVDGYGMKETSSIYCEPTISIANGYWTLTTAPDMDISTVFNNSNIYSWTGAATIATGSDDRFQATTADEMFVRTLANLYHDLKVGYITFRLEGGKCSALYYTTEQSGVVSEMPAFAAGGWSVDEFAWDNYDQGVTTNGIIVGTSPVLQLAVA